MRKNIKKFSVYANGGSMFPLLRDGDKIEYIQAPFHTIKLNDIILTYVDDILVTHRVIYKTKKTCITRGDNNTTADVTTQKSKVLAKVVRFKRNNIWYDLQDFYFIQSGFYLEEIKKLETILCAYGISHVFLKGVLVSLRYEGFIPKRIYADCDILINRYDYKKLEKAFTALGYKRDGRSLFSSYKKKPEQKPEINYVKIVNNIPVVFDVHFEPVFLMTQIEGMNLLYQKEKLTQLGNDIIKRGKRKKIKGFVYSICSISDQILYLALHIFHHNYTDSVRYQLLDAVIRKASNKQTWKDLQNNILQYNLEGYVYGVFILLTKYFKTPIPKSFFHAIRPSSFKKRVNMHYLKRVDIFSQDHRVKAGVVRFILIFLLSPEPIWKKMSIFFYIKILTIFLKIFPSLFKSIYWNF